MSNSDLVSTIKARFDHHESKEYLKEKYSNKLTLISQGGLWSITPEFLGFLRSSKSNTIILDNYNNPIKVNSELLLEQAELLYNKVMTDWLEEFEKLSKVR